MASEPELSEMWASALAEYERDTKRVLDRKMLERMRTVAGPEDLLAEIEASDHAFRDFRNKRGGLWRKLSAFVPPLAAALKIAITPASVSDAVGIPASAVFGALLYLVRSCENVSNAYDWIEEVFGELKRFLDRLTALMQAPLHTLLKDQVVAILVCVLRVIGRSEALIRGSHFRQYLRVTFLGKDEKTTKIIGDFNKLVANEHLIEVSLTLATAQKIEEKQEINTTEIRNDIQEVHDAIKEGQERETADQIHERIQRILCGSSTLEVVQETYHRIKKDLLQGTGAWLRDEPLFQSWIQHQASILWIFGGPGAGKSYLAAWITMQLAENLIDPEYTRDNCVAYFFVKENNKDLRDANNILKTLAWQLCDKDPHFKAHVAATCKDVNPTFTPEDTWENLFLAHYNCKQPSPMKATIVIDGLDEAPRETRQILLGFLKRLVSASRSSSPSSMSIQFAVVGRNDLRNDMEFTRHEKFYLIKVDKTKNHDDIDSYVRRRLEDVEILRRMRRIKPRGKQDANAAGARIKKRILAGADGVFLWARLLIKMILNKDLAQIEDILREPPETLDDMIESVLDRMASDKDLGHQLLRKMLLYVVYVQRPLRFGELDLFLSLPDRKPNLLLWERSRGVLSAIFDLRFPNDKDPDEEDSDEEEAESGDDGENEDGSDNDDADNDDDEDEGGFDFTGDDNEDADADDGKEQDIFVPIASHRLRTSWEVQLRRQNTTTLHQTYLNDGQLKTEITFCHARFKDYLQREGRSKDRNKPVHAIIPETDRVHIEMTMMCLEVFRLEYSLKDHSRYLVDYPLNYLGFHIRRVDPKHISDFEFGKIAKGLHWLFGTEMGAVCFVLANQDYDSDGCSSSESAFSRNWVTSVDNWKVVQSWFREVASRSGSNVDIDHDTRVWMQSASEGYVELLKHVMMAASKNWLIKPSYDSDDYRVKGYFPCWLMEGWLSLSETGEVSTQLKGLDYSYDCTNFLERAPPSHLEHLASWAGLERDTHWHTCLGWMLMSGYAWTEAIAHYDLAIQLSPEDAWVAMEGRARCHGDMSEYQEAIDWQRRAIESLPEMVKSIGAYLYPRIADWAAALGDEEASFQAAEFGIDIDSSSLIAQARYIEALYRREDSGHLMYIFEWLNEQITDDRGYSWLVRLLVQGDQITEEMGWACRRAGKPAWVLDVLVQVEEQLEKGVFKENTRSLVWWSYQLMLFHQRWYDDCADQVIRHGERFLASLKLVSPELQQAYEKERSWTVDKLAQIYYDKAVAAWDEGRGANKATPLANKLKMLAVSVATSTAEGFEGFDFFRKDYPALLWGRWLRDFLQADENAWRESFKVRLLEEMKSLDDEDPANDTSGIGTLSVSLFHAGDRKNAAALLAILFQPLEDYEGEEEEQEEEEDEEKEGEETKEDDMLLGEADHTDITDKDDDWEDVKREEQEDAGQEEVGEQGPQINETEKGEHEASGDAGNKDQLQQMAERSGEKDEDTQQPQDLTEPAAGTEPEPEPEPEPPGPGLLVRRRTMPRNVLALNVEQWSWAYSCDNCERDASKTSEFYFCEVCDQTHWCGECLPMVRDHTLEPGLRFNACNPTHDMYRAWPIDSEARDLAAVYIDGGAQLRREWLEELRARWLRVGA